jgi:hypothetical protein
MIKFCRSWRKVIDWISRSCAQKKCIFNIPANIHPFRYELMLTCWQVNPDDRPTFAKICSQLRKLLENESSKYYLDAIENNEIFETKIFDSEESEEVAI